MRNFFTFADHRSASFRCIFYWILFSDGIITIIAFFAILLYSSAWDISPLESLKSKWPVILKILSITAIFGFMQGASRSGYHKYISAKLKKSTQSRNNLISKRENLLKGFKSELEYVNKYFTRGINNAKVEKTPYQYFKKIFTMFYYCPDVIYTSPDEEKATKIFNDACQNTNLLKFRNESYDILQKMYSDLEHQFRLIYQLKIDNINEVIKNLERRVCE